MNDSLNLQGFAPEPQKNDAPKLQHNKLKLDFAKLTNEADAQKA
jgi:hypothetical protein